MHQAHVYLSTTKAVSLGEEHMLGSIVQVRDQAAMLAPVPVLQMFAAEQPRLTATPAALLVTHWVVS